MSNSCNATKEGPLVAGLQSGYFHPTLRTWQSSHSLREDNLMYPVFIVEDDTVKEEITSLPGQYRWGIDSLVEYLQTVVPNGLHSILLFGIINESRKDNTGSFADDPMNPVIRAIPKLKRAFPTLLIACDVCLCPYTDHGHCGIFTEKIIDNAISISRIAEIATAYAQAGAHIVAPSDMMDNRIDAIHKLLITKNIRSQVSIMSYSSKFASCFYGPFRDAVQSSPSFGDRQTYQLPVNARGLALRASTRDVEQGADIIMVKPAGPFLDIVRDVANLHPNVPLAVYHVSGEYACLYHAAKAGAFDLHRALFETLNGFMRAGARIIITYFAPTVLLHMSEERRRGTF